MLFDCLFVRLILTCLFCFIPHKVILQLWTSERKCSQSLSYTPPSSTSDCNEPVKILLPSENVGRTFSRTNLEKLHDVCDIKYSTIIKLLLIYSDLGTQPLTLLMHLHTVHIVPDVLDSTCRLQNHGMLAMCDVHIFRA